MITVLDDVMLHLMNRDTPIPRDLEGFCVIALRNHVLNSARGSEAWLHENEVSLEEADRELNLAAAENDAPSSGGRDPARQILRRIFETVLLRLSPADRQLLAYAIERVPTRLVAEWTHLEHSNAKVKSHRLKRRLRADILAEIARLSPSEHASVARFFARAGITALQPAVAVAEVIGADGPHAPEAA